MGIVKALDLLPNAGKRLLTMRTDLLKRGRIVDHVHILLQIHDDFGRAMLAPTISRIVQQMKGYVTKQAGFSLWQKLYYDEVIRNESHYLHCWNYIEGNPSKWLEDEYYQT